MKSTDNEFKMMTQQLRLTNSDEDVAAYLAWIIKSDAAREYWLSKPTKMTTCGSFVPRTDTTSTTICRNCGMEKYLHDMDTIPF